MDTIHSNHRSRLDAITDLGLGLLLVSSWVYFFSYPGVDNDLWGHLFFGKEILQRGHIPLKNIYSFTAADHPWINHEWLAEVIFYGIYSMAGTPGLLLLKVIVGGGVIGMLHVILGKREHSSWTHVLTLIWVMAILAPGFNIRPQIFTYLLFSAFLVIFNQSQEKGPSTLSLYWVALLTLVWVNLHGGFVAGIGALGVFFLMNIIPSAFRGEIRWKDLRHVCVPLALTFLALLGTPFGATLLEFLWRDLRLDRPITEWEPIPLWGFSFIEMKLAVLLVLFVVRRKSWLRWDFVLTLLAALVAFQHQRHSPLFAIAAAPFLAQGVEEILGYAQSLYQDRGRKDWLTALKRILAPVVFAIALVLLGWVGKVHWKHGLRLVVSPMEYPTQAADFLQRNGIHGNMAVPFDWGEYFIWKLYPAVRVSIDGRYTTAYPMEVINDSWDWMSGGESWKRLLQKYPAEIAVTNRGHPVTVRLRNDSEWVYIYSDPTAFVFVKKTPRQEPLLKKFRSKGLLPPKAPSLYFPG